MSYIFFANKPNVYNSNALVMCGLAKGVIQNSRIIYNGLSIRRVTQLLRFNNNEKKIRYEK